MLPNPTATPGHRVVVNQSSINLFEIHTICLCDPRETSVVLISSRNPAIRTFIHVSHMSQTKVHTEITFPFREGIGLLALICVA
jgi:hypothetical protein